ncbi:MAG: glycoside hydrolase family 32 protein [Lachnospiraceae bacterium]
MDKNIIHLKAPGNWINDPNGFIYYKGEYHLFYQYFPYAPRWGTMHWGHAVSKDLVSWKHKGVALFPTKHDDQNGCFSGSAIEYNGKMYVYYTGVRYDTPDPDNIHMALHDQFVSSQMMIVSDDGFSFDNFNSKKTIISPIEDEKVGDKAHTRDPKVWRGKDAWYMLLGSKGEDENGKILIYKSEDLKEWTFVNSASKKMQFGNMWECPDYFETEGEKILVFSPMKFLNDGKNYADHAVCMKVEFDEDTCKMILPEKYQFLDYGLDLYAPQSTVDEEGRRVIIAWMRMPEAVEGKWNGMFCIPRVVEVKNGHIYFRVHPNVENRFTRQIQDVKEANQAGYKVSFDIEDGETVDIGGYKISRKGNKIYTDRSEVFVRQSDYRTQFESPEVREGYHLDVYVDSNLIEVFINNGEYVISNIVYGLKQEINTECEEKLEIVTVESLY